MSLDYTMTAEKNKITFDLLRQGIEATDDHNIARCLDIVDKLEDLGETHLAKALQYRLDVVGNQNYYGK